jgi:glycosyltransferase involved in cell wall biosynthesis
MNHRTAAIIPAYNEASTIGAVVATLLHSKLLDEVMVVSDGSEDSTGMIAEEAGARVIQLPRNSGKGAAMLHGLTHTDANVIVFFDADLRGLTVDHIERLVLPVINGARSMNVGIRDRGSFLSKVTTKLPLISGERAMSRQVIEGIPPKYLQGFMIESALNYYCRSRGLTYGSVFLPGLSIRRKYEKVGIPRAVVQYMRMSLEVVKAMIVVRFARLFNRF